MKKFVKGEKLTSGRLNELVAELEALRAQVAELKEQGAAAAQVAAVPGAVGGTAVGVGRMRYKAKVLHETMRCTWEPVYLDHRNGLKPPGTPGWYIRKGGDQRMEAMPAAAQYPECGGQLFLKETVGGAMAAPGTVELVYKPFGEKVCDVWGNQTPPVTVQQASTLWTRLGEYGVDCRYGFAQMEHLAERRRVTFYPARRVQRAYLQTVQSELKDEDGGVAMWGNRTVALAPCGALPAPEDGSVPVRALKPVGAARMEARDNRILIAGGVKFRAEGCSQEWMMEGQELPHLEACCSLPDQAYAVPGTWTKLAAVHIGETELALHGFAHRPDLWSLRFAPGTLPMPVVGGAVEWRRYVPDVSSGKGVPQPGEMVCGEVWEEVSAACNVVVLAPERVSDFPAPCAWHLASRRTLVAPGKDEATGERWVWYSRQARDSAEQGWVVS